MPSAHYPAPPSGDRVTIEGGKLNVPDKPVIPFVEGDDIGPDIWSATQRVLDAAVEKSYKGEKGIVWYEIFAGEKAHNMFGEWLPEATVDAVARTRARGGRIVEVGTTATRVLESCATDDRTVRACSGTTHLFLAPGDEFRIVDALLTNFHLPRSSLLLLVAAFAGRANVLAAYAEAVRENYRFYSYGDAMLIR